MNAQKELSELYERLEAKHEALKESHSTLISATAAFVDVLKDEGLIRSLPLIEEALTKAKKLES